MVNDNDWPHRLLNCGEGPLLGSGGGKALGSNSLLD